MNRRGFTLLELLVATTIFAIVLAACYALFESSRSVSSRAELRAQLFQNARGAFRILEEDLRGAVMSKGGFDAELRGTDEGSADEPYDQIEVVAINTHTLGATEKKMDLSKVTYWIYDGSGSKHGLVRERQATLTPVTVFARREENIEEIAPEIVALNVRYYDGAWKDAWDTTRENKLPKAIEATVHVEGEWRGEKVVEKFTTRFYLPVAAETPERTQ